MSSEVTVAFVKQFGGEVFHLAQQQGSRLRPRVRNESQKGDAAFYDRIGLTTAATKSSRHADTPQMDTPHSRRMVTLVTKNVGDMIDNDDKVRMLLDPQNEYVMAFMWALGRAIDSEIIAAAYGNAYGGVAGATAVPLPAAQKVASVASSAGAMINVQALRRAKRILDSGECPDEDRNGCINAIQLEALLAQTEVTSSDYANVKALVHGEVNTFLGFNFVRTELITDVSGTYNFDTTSGAVETGSGDADGYDQCIFWHRSALLLASGQDPKAEIAKRADKSFATQVYAEMSVGATRMEEARLVLVLAKES